MRDEKLSSSNQIRNKSAVKVQDDEKQEKAALKSRDKSYIAIKDLSDLAATAVQTAINADTAAKLREMIESPSIAHIPREEAPSPFKIGSSECKSSLKIDRILPLYGDQRDDEFWNSE